MHDTYNTTCYPRFVCHHGNWDIYADASGCCAFIPTPQAALDGCKAGYFGDADYVRVTLGVNSRTPVNA